MRISLVALGCLLFLGCWFSPSPVQAQGLLIPKDRSLPPLALKYHRVKVTLRDRAAKTTVTQVFINHTNRLLEAMFIFPIPKGASVSDFALYINGKRTKGQVLERERALQIYQSIVRRMKDPGLIEHMGGNLFRARVYPIPRRGEQKLEISFTQVVPYVAGLHRYVYPLKTPRATRKTLQDFTLSVSLKTKAPLKNIYSPTHRISVARPNDHRATVGFEEERAQLNKDFVLYYSVSQKAVGLNLLAHRNEGENGYFLLMATPKISYASRELPGKNVTFVLDTSGSMNGPKMKWAKIALKSCLQKLNPKDHFNVVRFSTDVEKLFRNLTLAGKDKVKKALSFVSKMEAAGGTAMDEAMTKALKQRPKGPGINIVVLITDGRPTIGETNPKRILLHAKKYNKHKARIFTFGIGTSINIRLLDRLAQAHGGTGEYVRPNKEIHQKISIFYDKVRHPVLSDLQMRVTGGIRLYDVYPKEIPDLFRGGQIVLFGRYRGKGDTALVLTGKVGKKSRKFVFETAFPAKSSKHSFISPLWANRKIAYLLDEIRLRGERGELRQEVVRLAKKFGIVTPYTSYLVVEKKDRWRLGHQKTARRPIVHTGRRRWFRGSSTATPQGGGGAGGKRWRSRSRRRVRIVRRRLNIPGTRAPREESAAPPARRAPGRSYGHRPTSPKKSGPPRSATERNDDGLFDKESLKKAKGKKGVRLSRRLNRMKRSKVSRQGRGTRYVGGKFFVWRNGWQDRAYKKSMKVLHLRYLSKLYFKILRQRPDLRKYFALGSRVLVVISKKRAILIGQKEDSLSQSRLKKFLKK